MLFFTGMRVEEIAALLFKNIDFGACNGNGGISVVNAITQHEDRYAAVKAALNEDYRTKNYESKRIITMIYIVK